MEAENLKSFLESDIYKDPQKAFDEVIARLGCGEQLAGYLIDLDVVLAGPQHNLHQENIKPVLESLLQQGKKEEVGLMFNIHRTLTEFRGYGANDETSSDVEACFGEKFEIPEQGAIIVDFFVTQNLPKIVEICEKRGVDLNRIRVCVPKGILAAQLMKMSAEKRVEFEVACGKLTESQFIIEDVNHNSNIKFDEDVAIWFSPRTMPICPEFHVENEEQTIENYRDWFREKVSRVVGGGRIYANLAYGEQWQPLSVEVEVTKDQKKSLTKLTSMSKSTARAIVDLLGGELGFAHLGKGEFDPATVDSKIDHSKKATEMHFIKH